MATEQLSVSLEPDDRLWIDEAVRSGQIANASVFISSLIRDYREKVRIDALLAERLAGEPPFEPDAGFWDRKKEELRRQMSK